VNGGRRTADGESQRRAAPIAFSRVLGIGGRAPQRTGSVQKSVANATFRSRDSYRQDLCDDAESCRIRFFSVTVRRPLLHMDVRMARNAGNACERPSALSLACATAARGLHRRSAKCASRVPIVETMAGPREAVQPRAGYTAGQKPGRFAARDRCGPPAARVSGASIVSGTHHLRGDAECIRTSRPWPALHC
jgi:hypothetical protein